MAGEYSPPAVLAIEEEDELPGVPAGQVNPLHGATSPPQRFSVDLDAVEEGQQYPRPTLRTKTWLKAAWALTAALLVVTFVLASTALSVDRSNQETTSSRTAHAHKDYKSASTSVADAQATSAGLVATDAELVGRLVAFQQQAITQQQALDADSAASTALADEASQLSDSVNDVTTAINSEQSMLTDLSAEVAAMQSDLECPTDIGVLPGLDPPVAFNGHWYQWVPAPYHYSSTEFKVGLLWKDAERDAASRCHKGLQGYMATITSQEEQDVINSLIPPLSYPNYEFIGWLGGADRSTEGTWKWTDGPEQDVQFWSGNGDTGHAVNSAYTNWYCHQDSNWNYCEPNNANNQDCLHAYGDGHWNDIKCSVRGTGYFVEYGV